MASNASSNINNSKGDPKTRTLKKVLRNKTFVERNSTIDELMEDQHLVVVYRIAIVVIVSLSAHTAIYEYYYNGKINFGQDLILTEFSKFSTFWYTWFLIYLSTFLVYYGLKYWATTRTSLQKKTNFDNFFFGFTMISYPGWLCVVSWFVFQNNLTNTLSLAIFSEITRLMMKIHAFIRSNVPRVLCYKPSSANGEPLYPSLYQFVYFLWCPTLIYRDSYPRTKNIRWSYVGSKLLEFIVLVFTLSLIVERYFLYHFKDYGLKPYTWGDIAVIIFGNAGGGLLLTLSTVYLLFQVWHNAFAEICTFADRGFYEDWWNSSDFERYYRTWNVVVHDWLYNYIYKDFYEILVPGNKFIAKYVVFTISAIFHEYILGFGFGFFMPIMFIQFITLGTIMTYIKIKPHIIGNLFLLYSLALGNSINGTFFALEYYARLNCPSENATLYSYFIPRLFSCSPSAETTS